MCYCTWKKTYKQQKTAFFVLKKTVSWYTLAERTANRILGGFRYIHLTKGTFILNFDSTLPLFNSKNNSKLKFFEQKFKCFLGLKI